MKPRIAIFACLLPLLLAQFDSPLRSVAWHQLDALSRVAVVIGCVVIPVFMLCVLAAGGRKERRLGAALVGVLALLWGSYAGATTYYVHSTAGNDANAGTESEPLATVAAITQLSGDVIYLAGGQTFREQITVGADSVSIFAYGEGRALVDCENTRSYGVYVRSYASFRMEDVNIANCLEIGLEVTNNVASTSKAGPTLRRVTVWGTGGSSVPGGEAGQRYGNGITIGAGPSTALATLDGVLLEDVVAYGNKKHGIDFVWDVRNVVTRRVDVYGNGYAYSGHGLSHHPVVSQITSGWSAAGGGVYSRAKVTGTDPMADMKDLTTPSFLTQNTATPTTPAEGEWGHSGSTMYVRLPGDADPNTKSMYVKRAVNGPFLHEDLKAHHNVAGVVNEGHGMSADNFTSDVTCRRCEAWENEGAGLKSFRGKNIRFESSISYRNAQQGFDFVLTSGGDAVNVTASNNGHRGVQWITGALDSEALNVVSIGNDTSGTIGTGTGIFMVGSGTGTLTQGGLRVFGNNGSTQSSNVTATTVDPLFIGGPNPTTARGFRLKSSSPLIGAGTCYLTGSCVHRDFDGRRHLRPPNIGAFATGFGDQK